MLIPLEVSIGFAAGAVSLVLDAMSERSAIRRATSVSAAIGALMIAIAGRFPGVPGDYGASLFEVAGIYVFSASIFIASVARFFNALRERRARYDSVSRDT